MNKSSLATPLLIIDYSFLNSYKFCSPSIPWGRQVIWFRKISIQKEKKIELRMWTNLWLILATISEVCTGLVLFFFLSTELSTTESKVFLRQINPQLSHITMVATRGHSYPILARCNWPMFLEQNYYMTTKFKRPA